MQKNSAQRAPVPTESVEQQLLFRWARFYVSKYPELALLYHIPNGGSRRKSEAGRFKADGAGSGSTRPPMPTTPPPVAAEEPTYDEMEYSVNDENLPFF